MFVELFATYLRLQKWKENPHATKCQIGIMSSWMTADPANDRPISSHELENMKDFLRTGAPTSFAESLPRQFLVLMRKETTWHDRTRLAELRSNSTNVGISCVSAGRSGNLGRILITRKCVPARSSRTTNSRARQAKSRMPSKDAFSAIAPLFLSSIEVSALAHK